MAFPAKEWAKAAPQLQGVDPGRLADAVRYLEEHAGPDGVKRLVIVRRGRMIWSGSEADRRQPVASITKAFTSTAHGLLIADGKCTLDTLAREFNPEHLAERYPLVTLRHLATMTSGYDGVGGSLRLRRGEAAVRRQRLRPAVIAGLPAGDQVHVLG